MQLTKLMERFVADGRSTPGEKQKNDVAVQLLKKPKAGKPPRKDRKPPEGPDLQGDVRREVPSGFAPAGYRFG